MRSSTDAHVGSWHSDRMDEMDEKEGESMKRAEESREMCIRFSILDKVGIIKDCAEENEAREIVLTCEDWLESSVSRCILKLGPVE